VPRSDIAGLAVACVLAVAGTWSDTVGIMHPAERALSIAAFGYLVASVLPMTLAVVTEHPRRGLIIWLTVASIACLFPCVVAAWWVLIAQRRRPAEPWGGRVDSSPAGPCAAHLVTDCTDCGPDAGTPLDYATLALTLVELSVSQLDYAAEIAPKTAPVWVFTLRDDLDKARSALAALVREMPGGLAG